MSIEFDEQKYINNRETIKKSGFSTFLVEKGVVETKEQANYVLLGIVVISVLLSFMFLSFGNDAQELTQENFVPAEI